MLVPVSVHDIWDLFAYLTLASPYLSLMYIYTYVRMHMSRVAGQVGALPIFRLACQLVSLVFDGPPLGGRDSVHERIQSLVAGIR